MSARYHGYVALGDSFTEGMNDRRADGGFRGWADLTARRLAETNPGLTYANLAVRGKLFDAVVDEQVPQALRLRPDLVSFIAGGNDALRPGFQPERLSGRLNEVARVLTASGAKVLLCTVPTVPPRMPASRLLTKRMLALNAIIRTVARRHGATVVELYGDEIFQDTRLWSEDRVHMSALGHRRVAEHCCETLEIPPDPCWRLTLPTAEPPGWLTRRREDVAWAKAHMAPWVRRRLAGKSSGDAVSAKRPKLTPIGEIRPS
ncbi:MAG TPA: SGNH/GDSL hydrolase family protein [Stackebrandtia sp.]|jgi:lysophospholipase L1-like esterase|uniref:SGNH/GDSL hydrolase family protein n=1 Tax=Stackebrandtia sp. TaxID=2023065 RepID=UPI002D71CF2B|nr:SGNH/GDSL hydrolase family protein [Stackebrandtia sp.]HZE40768.1 SGNH/GDSL hydrolase family protein [Stackebrandtia sp.]